MGRWLHVPPRCSSRQLLAIGQYPDPYGNLDDLRLIFILTDFHGFISILSGQTIPAFLPRMEGLGRSLPRTLVPGGTSWPGCVQQPG